jgi:uncharacterized membrane protein YkvA (DUF1232 family)
MSMRFVINLTDRDLRFFRQALKRSRNAIDHADESEIIEAVNDVLEDIKSEEPLPDFVAKRVPELESMMRMLRDDEWALPKDERERLLAAFIYFGDPEDILPDNIPVVGYLDDVIIIELVVREMRHVREAYDEFCKFRETARKRVKKDRDEASYREHIARKRISLHKRMKRRVANDRQKKKSTALW